MKEKKRLILVAKDFKETLKIELQLEQLGIKNYFTYDSRSKEDQLKLSVEYGTIFFAQPFVLAVIVDVEDIDSFTEKLNKALKERNE